MFEFLMDFQEGTVFKPEDREVVMWVMGSWMFHIDVIENQDENEFTNSLATPDLAFGRQSGSKNRTITLTKCREAADAVVLLIGLGCGFAARDLIKDVTHFSGWVLEDSHGGAMGWSYASAIYRNEEGPEGFYTGEY